MIAKEVGAASGFTAVEISSLAARGTIPSSGGGMKGKPRTFDPQIVGLCRIARLLIDDMSLPPADAFRIAQGIADGKGRFGRFTVVMNEPVTMCGIGSENGASTQWEWHELERSHRQTA